jgi:drug/metabolite transporter (DMT)-like permease
MKPSAVVSILSVFVVLMWGATAWLRLLSISVPPLELTAIALFGAALTSGLFSGHYRLARGALGHHHPWYVWLIVIVGLVGSSGFFYTALNYAPAAQVVVITYSWPLLFAIASDVYSGRRPSPLTLIGLLIGFAGIYVMQGTSHSPSTHAWLGYACGLASGLCWVGYSLLFQMYKRPIASAYPAFFTTAAVTALVLQIASGGLVWPSSSVAWLASIALGIGPFGLGFIAWGYIVQHGNPHVVPVLPYGVPIVAAITLIMAGHSQPSLSLFAGCALVIAACVVVTCFHSPRSAV